MKIVICGSINFTYEIKEVADKLNILGHKAEIPYTAKEILNGELTIEQFKKEKETSGDGVFRKVSEDLIRRYYKLIKKSEAILVLNLEKNGVRNYIGGNSFLEMGFAHCLNKKIYLWNDIPEMIYMDEIKAMRPIILRGNLKNL